MAAPPSGAERRQYPRRPLALRVEYPDRGTYLSHWTENVSQGGLFVRTDASFALGESVRLRISFPGLLEPVDLEGSVVWRREPGTEGGGGIGVRVDEERGRRKLAELALASSNTSNPRPSYRVLVVEDNPRFFESYELVLKRATKLTGSPITMLTAENGHEALRRLEEGPVDLVITDLSMPVMDGLALTRALRADPRLRQVPIVAVAANREVDEQTLREAGVDALLPKPFQLGQILETVGWLLCLR